MPSLTKPETPAEEWSDPSAGSELRLPRPAAPATEHTLFAAWLIARWESLGAPTAGRRVPGTMVVAFAALAVGVVAVAITTSSGLNIAYADAQSHLTISRRLFDSMAPGFTQLGTVWLPVPSLVLVPFVTNLWLWHTGLAAGLLGLICLMGTATGVYRIAARIGLGRAARIIGVLLIIANPSILYMYTTALTEPVLIVCMMGCFAGLAHWVTSKRNLQAGEMMVFCGLPAAGATLSRYEGWVLVFAGTLLVMWVSWRKKRLWRYCVKMGLAFAALPGVAIAWWLVYNYTVYGNPLEFANGQYSASNLQKATADAGLLAYTHNAGLTLYTYNWSVLETAGLLTVLLGLAGAVVLAYTRGLSNEALVVWIMGVAYAFSLLSLFLGQTHMNNDHSLPQNWWNSRYTLAVIPWLAVLAAVFVDSVRRQRFWMPALAVLGLALILQTSWWAADPTRSSVIAEADGYVQLKAASGATAAAAYLRDNYDGGDVLMDESAAGSALLPEIGIPLVDYYNRSTGELFTQAIANPATHAKWVFVSTADAPELSETGVADLVYDSIKKDPSFGASYRVVFDQGSYRIYERIDS
ncbi:ArnT family glycosyltransferase [Subtercola sp. YIM 133946]|uniref:ArnT family glycosyltransferase n=1 Tax=Subtercola sp. YIM 133946 TaxID=3118909 RepID=UPI002F9401F0